MADEVKREALRARFDQAMALIKDEGTFSRDQLTTLCNVIVLLRWGIEEELAALSKAEGGQP